jgi:hypothetical protein
MTDCLFSGETTDSDEHVIPLWLQQRLNLGNQTLYLPNGTSLRYKHVKVPAKREHNSKFSQIENRISQGVFEPQEVYLWAYKIHLGLIYRDATLRWNIQDPNAPMIFDRNDFQSDIFLFQRLYRAWASGGDISPKPFGSVLVVDSLAPHDRFDLIHCLLTGTVAIDIGDKFILVLLWDQGFANGSNSLEIWNSFYKTNVAAIPLGPERDLHAYLAHHAWAAEVAYFAHRHSRSFSTVSTETQVLGVATGRAVPLEFSQSEYDRVALNFYLERYEDHGNDLPKYRMREPQPQTGS